MTTYTTIPNTDIDQDSPITQPLMTALRDNPIAMAEADSSVAETLKPTVLLGTLDGTGGGSTMTLGSLTLTNYKMLAISFDGLSHNSGTNQNFTFAGITLLAGTINSSGTAHGVIHVYLANGEAFHATSATTVGLDWGVSTTSLSTATTSLSFATSAGGNFDAGDIYIYGVK